MAEKMLTKSLQEYRIYRAKFAKIIADFSLGKVNIAHLETARIIDLLKPLVTDPVPSIQQTSTLALGRIANKSEMMCTTIIEKDVVKDILKQPVTGQCHRKMVLFLLRAICKHSAKLAHDVVEAGGIAFAVMCLQDYETSVKENAAWLLGYIAKHNRYLAMSVIQNQAVILLVQALLEPKTCLKQIASNALYDISKHDVVTAEAIMDCGGLLILKNCLEGEDVIVRRNVLNVIGNICSHSEELTHDVIRAGLFTTVMRYMKSTDDVVQANAGHVVREVAKTSPRLAEIVAALGGIEMLLEVLDTGSLNVKLQALVAIGAIAASSPEMAGHVMDTGGEAALLNLLNQDQSDAFMCALVWCMCQVAKQSRPLSQGFSQPSVIKRMLDLSNDESSTNELKSKIKDIVTVIVQRCMSMETLTLFLDAYDPVIVKSVLAQVGKLIVANGKARSKFLTSGGFKMVQTLANSEDFAESIYQNEIMFINKCYPNQVSYYYNAICPESFLDAAEHYIPEAIDPVD